MAVAGFGRASLLFGWSLRGLHRLRLLVGLEAFGGPFHSFAHGGRYGESAVGEGVEWVGVDDSEACCEGEPGVVVWPHPASELVDVGRADLVAAAAEWSSPAMTSGSVCGAWPKTGCFPRSIPIRVMAIKPRPAVPMGIKANADIGISLSMPSF